MEKWWYDHKTHYGINCERLVQTLLSRRQQFSVNNKISFSLAHKIHENTRHHLQPDSEIRRTSTEHRRRINLIQSKRIKELIKQKCSLRHGHHAELLQAGYLTVFRPTILKLLTPHFKISCTIHILHCHSTHVLNGLYSSRIGGRQGLFRYLNLSKDFYGSNHTSLRWMIDLFPSGIQKLGRLEFTVLKIWKAAAWIMSGS